MAISRRTILVGVTPRAFAGSSMLRSNMSAFRLFRTSMHFSLVNACAVRSYTIGNFFMQIVAYATY
jgi:hypothetical protein